MSLESLNCPNCGAPLPEAEGRSLVVCRHCGSAIRITTPVVSTPKPARPPEPAAPRPPVTTGDYGRPPSGRPERSELASVTLGPSDVAHIVQLIRDKQRLTAIQYYQDRVGGSLGEAKDAIEAIEAGLKDASAPLTPGSVNSNPPRMSEIHDLLKAGNRMQAIKRYQEMTGAGLRQSVTVIEGIERQIARSRGLPVPRPSSGLKSCLGLAGIVVIFIMLILGGCGAYLQTKPVYRCSIEAVKDAVVEQKLLKPPVQAGYLVLTPGFEESSGFSGWDLDAEYFAPVWGDGRVGWAYVALSANSAGYSAMQARLYLGGERYDLRPWGPLPCQ